MSPATAPLRCLCMDARRCLSGTLLLAKVKSLVRIPRGMLVARAVRYGKFGWSTHSSLSGEDSCFLVR